MNPTATAYLRWGFHAKEHTSLCVDLAFHYALNHFPFHPSRCFNCLHFEKRLFLALLCMVSCFMRSHGHDQLLPWYVQFLFREVYTVITEQRYSRTRVYQWILLLIQIQPHKELKHFCNTPVIHMTLTVSLYWYQSPIFEHSQITGPGEERLCLSKKHLLFFSIPWWSISTPTRKNCPWEPQMSSVCMAHLLTEISATGVTCSETKICLLGIEPKPQTHFLQGKQKWLAATK